MMRACAFSVCLLLVLLPGQMQAQDTSDVAFRVQMPDSVVVTASRSVSPTEEAGRRVSVYTRRDIEAFSVNSVDQLLDVVAGLDVQSRGGSACRATSRCVALPSTACCSCLMARASTTR